MSRVQIGNTYVGPSGDLYGGTDPSSIGGLTLVGGNRWYRTSVASATYPYPTYTDRPVIKYTTQLYQPGDTFDVVLSTRLPAYLAANSLGSTAYVEIPAGFDEQINGFNQVSNQYGCYAPACVGVWGQGPDQSRISMKSQSMSTATKNTIPTQSAGGVNNVYAFRVGPTGQPIHNYGFTLGGRDQGINPATSLPWNYNGFFCYQESGGSTHTWIKVLGFGAADYNNPPGETNQVNMYRCSDITLNGVEVSGYNLDGTQTGGACAPNGSTNVTYTDVNIHDTFRSGCTQSTAGSAQSGTRTTNITTTRLKAVRNANIPATPTPGAGFPGINHEGVAGTVQHNYPEILRQNASGWNACHIFIGNAQGSCTLNIIEPNYHPEIASAQPSYAHGCLAVQCLSTYAGGAQQQQISDIHVILNGVTLTPVINSTGGVSTSANPATNFVVLTV